MPDQLHHELKKEFQLERLILFSDAVFAIAITLLVIEIKIPELHEEISDKALLTELKHLIPKFLGFMISFIFIGLYWSIHHRIFGFVTHYNRRLIFLNLLYLFCIALMPFSNGIYGEYSGPGRVSLITPVVLYNLNIMFTGLVSLITWTYVSNPKNGVGDGIPDKIRKNYKKRLAIIPMMFFVSLIVAFFSPLLARYVYILIPLVMRLAIKRDPRGK